ncbi:MAG: hypothetical protein HND57_02365 [Planctomycetes bacterium]|nr:hypothetical protein [Planctomycetota bacterium]
MGNQIVTAFVAGGLCGIAAVVAGALTIGGSSTKTDQSPIHTLPTVVAEADEAEGIVSNLSVSGSPTPWDWKRWLTIREGQERVTIRNLFGQPANYDLSTDPPGTWEYDKKPDAVMSKKYYTVTFKNNRVDKWKLDHLPIGPGSPLLFLEPGNWAALESIPNATIDDVMKHLGEPTSISGDQNGYSLFYRDENSDREGKVTIKFFSDTWQVGTVEAPFW